MIARRDSSATAAWPSGIRGPGDAGRVAALSLCVTLAACGPSAPDLHLRVRPADQQPAAPVELAFAWPVPSSAIVREEIQKSASTLAVRYRIELRAAADELVLRTSDLELEHVGGRGPRTAEERAAVAPVLASIESAMPTIRVARDGAFLGVVDVEAWIESAIAAVELQIEALPEESEGRERAVQALRARTEMMRSATMRPALERTAGERWEAWVASWRGTRGTVGESSLRATTVTLPWAPLGAEVELPTTVVGYVFRPDSCVRVEMFGDLEPSTSSNPLTRMLASAAGAGLDAVSARFGRGAVFDPATMQPLHVESRLQLRRETERGPSESDDVRIWDFEWEMAPADEAASR